MPAPLSTPTPIHTATARLSYDTTGEPGRPPLLLIQGLGAQSLGWHPDLCRQLADAGYYVLRIDNRDVGLSQKFPDGGYTLGDMAVDTAGAIIALGLGPVHVVGQSMGGMIVQELMLRFPRLLRSATLVYSCAHPDRINTNLVTERGDSLMTTPATRDDAVAAYLENESYCATEQYPPDTGWLAELGGQMYDRDPALDAVPRQYAAILSSRDRRPLLPSVDIPTAVICGDSDRLIDPEASAELHQLLPHSSLTVHRGMGHALPQPLWTDIVDSIDLHCRASSGTTADTSVK